jgi:hypothetical protein
MIAELAHRLRMKAEIFEKDGRRWAEFRCPRDRNASFTVELTLPSSRREVIATELIPW